MAARLIKGRSSSGAAEKDNSKPKTEGPGVIQRTGNEQTSRSARGQTEQKASVDAVIHMNAAASCQPERRTDEGGGRPRGACMRQPLGQKTACGVMDSQCWSWLSKISCNNQS